MAANAVTAARRVSFSAELRENTRDDHAKVEQLLGLPERVATVADLARLLHGWRMIWADVRAGCSPAAGAAGAAGPTGHDEVARLMVTAVRAVQQTSADLRALAMIDDSADDGSTEPGCLPVGAPLCGPLSARAPGAASGAASGVGPLAPLVATELGVWAASYVLRGSRIGAGILAPIVTRQLGLRDGLATAYHGDDTAGRSWVTFTKRLDDWGRAAGPADRDGVAALARDVFDMVGTRLHAELTTEDGR